MTIKTYRDDSTKMIVDDCVICVIPTRLKCVDTDKPVCKSCANEMSSL